MQFNGWAEADFDVFAVPGLEERMDKLKAQVRPKLEALGGEFADMLTDDLARPMFAHVAKHARRTVNPPNDSWVAFGEDKRGYKKYPHFQIGLWQTHVFITFGLIYESPSRLAYAQALKDHSETALAKLPEDYVFIPDHMDPFAIRKVDVDENKLEELTDRLAHRRNGELMIGRNIPKAEAITMGAAGFLTAAGDILKSLEPLYHLATREGVVR